MIHTDTPLPKLHPYKKQDSYSYTLGVFPTLELLHTRPELVMQILFHSKAIGTGVEQVRSLCATHHVHTEIADKAIQKLSDAENTYVIGMFRKEVFPWKTEQSPNHVVLVHPSDAGNLGTIMRTIVGLGVDHLVIIQPAVDMFHPKVVRASMGAVFHLHIQQFSTYEAYQQWAQTSYANTPVQTYPFMTHTKQMLPTTSFRTPWALVFGNEGAGLNETFHSKGTPVSIPQTGAVDSLNLAIAVGLGTYCAIQQSTQVS